MWIRGTAGPCREGAFAYANRPETAPIAPKPPPKTNLSMCTSSQQITRMLLNLQMKVPISGLRIRGCVVSKSCIFGPEEWHVCIWNHIRMFESNFASQTPVFDLHN